MDELVQKTIENLRRETIWAGILCQNKEELYALLRTLVATRGDGGLWGIR